MARFDVAKGHILEAFNSDLSRGANGSRRLSRSAMFGGGIIGGLTDETNSESMRIGNLLLPKALRSHRSE